MRLVQCVAFAALSVVAAGCGDRSANEDESGGAAPATTQVPLFTHVGLSELRASTAPALRAFVSGLSEDCQGREASFGEESISRAEMNGDDQPDYLVSMSGLICGGESLGNSFCGSGGCSYRLLASRGDDYHDEWIQSDGIAFARHGDRVALSVPGEDGVRLLTWNGEQLGEVETEQSQARVGREDAIRGAVAAIYSRYSGEAEWTEDIETADFRQAIERASDDGGLGYDPYCACQDFERLTYEISDVSYDSGGGWATVHIRNNEGDPYEIRLQLQEENGSWKVDDIIDANGSLRADLSEN